MNTNYFIAFDLGATSGRTILGKLKGEKLTLEEITRFPNQMLQWNGHFYWNIYSLYENLKKGFAEVARKGVPVTSAGIDTWGVDIVGVNADDELCGIPYAYRDPQNIGKKEEYFSNVMDAEKLYMRNGIQHMDFNTLFQLHVLNGRGCESMKAAHKILFIPDALNYMLTGKMVTEYNIASTSGMLDAIKRDWDEALLKSVNTSREQWAPLVKPGTIIGHLSPELAAELQIPSIPVVAVAEHDTASAVAAVPATDKNFAYLSSGTWSLMGIETQEPVINQETIKHNITNEGGVDGTIRLLKNITGMWILEQCLQRWKKDGTSYTYPEMVKMASEAKAFSCFINPDDALFVNPADMPEAINEYCLRTNQEIPDGHAAYIRMIFESLAMKYRETLDVFKTLSEHHIEKLHVIGGGSRNALLNQFTANAIEMPVIAGPAEASSVGNIMLQAKAAGIVQSLQEMRNVISANVELSTYYPQDSELWQAAYIKYRNIIGLH